MYRFVDLTPYYWADEDASNPPCCAIVDTVTDRFLDANGEHVLVSLDEVRRAAGERGVALVPDGFFGRTPPVQQTPGDAASTVPGCS